MTEAQPERVVSSLPAVIYAALLSGFIFAGVFSFFHYQQLEFTMPLKVALTVSVIFMDVLLAIIVYKKMAGQLTFTQAFLSGWASALLLALLVIIYQMFFYQVMIKAKFPENFWVPTVVIHNIIGALLSAILALIFKTRQHA
jgi:hypothetical protein